MLSDLQRAVLLGVAVAWLHSGCLLRSPVRVEYVGHGDLLGQLDVSALDGNQPSAQTLWLLRLMEAEERFDEDPRSVLTEVHEVAIREKSRVVAFEAAELAYLAGKRLEDRDCYLMAAVYALAYLTEDEWGEEPSPLDRRFRWACDIYNSSLGRAFAGPEPGTFELSGGSRDTPAGTVEVTVDTGAFPFPTEGLELLLSDELEVRGLSLRLRDPGLGAPLVAIVKGHGESTAGVGDLNSRSLAATAFLRPSAGPGDLGNGLSASLELHSTSARKELYVDGRAFPLEADPSAAIAHGIESAGYWRWDLVGFFRGANASRQNGLILPSPFQPDRIPVVLVHGTASNPVYWADLINDLSADPLIRERCQFWLFIYSTGNPIVYSSTTLRESLTSFVASRDPDLSDESLRQMVIVGHSQGGLLAKMTGVTMSAEDAAQQSFDLSLAELELEPEIEEQVRRHFDIEPLPFVERLVFVSTPHRGSFLSDRWFARMLGRLIAMPGDLVGLAKSVRASVPEEKLPRGMQSRTSTSLDNMRPGNSFLELLLDAPIDPRIRVHSIISIGGAEEPEGADDGVVAYESAHLDGVDSEALVRAKHSCQSHPSVVIEMRRILREHIALMDGQAEPSSPEGP
jgi:hypothetical protein